MGEITEMLGASQQNVSKHLSALLAEGFVARRKRGTSSLYRIADPGVHELCDGVSAGIESQLAELEAVFKQPRGGENPGAGRLCVLMGGKSATVDWRIARVAREQHGIVTTQQLVEVGLTRGAIAKRVQSGRLIAFIEVFTPWATRARAKRRGGWRRCSPVVPAPSLSHGAAAVHWGLLRPLDGPIDVSVPTRSGRKRRARHPHPPLRRPSLRRLCQPMVRKGARPAGDRARAHPRDDGGADACGPSLDLAPYLVRRAIRQAEFLRLPVGIETDRTRSDLERDFLRLCRRHRLPPPEVNVLIGGMTVDFLWRDARLVVETDSYATHGGTIAFEDDRARDLRLRRLGYSVHRFSERQLELEPAAVAADVGRGAPGDLTP